MSILVRTNLADIEKLEIKQGSGLILTTVPDVGRLLIYGVPTDVIILLPSFWLDAKGKTEISLEENNFVLDVEIDTPQNTNAGYKQAKYAGRLQIVYVEHEPEPEPEPEEEE